jgi:hypothetical protein
MALTPQELAALQAGIDPRAYFDDPMVAARAGLLDPETIQRGPSTIRPGTTLPASRADKAKDFAQNALTRARGAMGQIFLSGLWSCWCGCRSSCTYCSRGSTSWTSDRCSRCSWCRSGGRWYWCTCLQKCYQDLTVKLLVPFSCYWRYDCCSPGASLAESVKRSLTGDPTTGKDDLKNQLAERGLISKQDLDIYDRTQGIQTSNILNLNQGIADQEYLNMQRMNPLLQKMENAKLVRAQALMASQGQQYAMLGTLATAGKLATGSQAERGATVRTVLGSNPYASANLQAPGISFG